MYDMIAISLFFFACFLLADAVIPKACVGNLTSSPAVCCPIPVGFHQPCGGPERGLCEPVKVFHDILIEKYHAFYSKDIRFRWPERFFQLMCKCQGTFFGPGCGECWFGYEGPNCDRRVTKKRRSIMTLNATERRQYVEVSMKLRETKSDYVVPKLRLNQIRWTGEYTEVDPVEMLTFVHYLSGIPEINNNKKRCLRLEAMVWNYGHMGSGFLSYHRYLLMWLEREYAKVAKKFFGIENFALPYWDWTNSRVCDPCTDDLIGAPSKVFDPITSGYFVSNRSQFGTSRWKVYCQDKVNVDNICFPCQIDRTKTNKLTRRLYQFDFPTAEEVIEFLSLTTYHNRNDQCADVENVLESSWNCTCKWKPTNIMLHSTVHQYIHGTMDPLPSSVYDPMFVLHHAQVDRLFERWLRGVLPTRNDFLQHARSPPQCRDCFMGTFIPTVKYRDVFVDTRELGYTFDNLNFGSLSEKIKITHWNNKYYKKKCPKYSLKMTRLDNRVNLKRR